MAERPDRLDPDPAQLKREIAHTRAEMTETIDALGARFEPSYIKEQAQEAITDTARSAGTSMLDTIKDNPLPAGIAAMSIAWLFANRSSGTPPPRRAHDARYAAYPPQGYAATQVGVYGGGTTDPSLTDRASGAADQARDAAGNAIDGARDKAGNLLDDAKGTASDLADQARNTAQDASQQAQQYAQQAETWLEGQMNQNPLGVGAVALAAGALVGLSLPETQMEMDLMREPASQIVDRAQRVASETFEQAKTVASKVADEATDKAKEVADEAKAEAKKVAKTAKSEAKDVASDASSRAKKAAKKSASTGTSASAGRTTTDAFDVPKVKK